MYRNIMLVFLSPFSIFYFCLWGMVKLSVLNTFECIIFCATISSILCNYCTYNPFTKWSFIIFILLNQIMHEKRYFFRNYYNQMISIHSVRILPFLAIMSLLAPSTHLKGWETLPWAVEKWPYRGFAVTKTFLQK